MKLKPTSEQFNFEMRYLPWHFLAFATFLVLGGCGKSEVAEEPLTKQQMDGRLKSLVRTQESLTESIRKLESEISEFRMGLKAQLDEQHEFLEKMGYKIERLQPNELMAISTHYAVIELLAGNAESLFHEVVAETPDRVTRVLAGIDAMRNVKGPIMADTLVSALDMDWSGLVNTGGSLAEGWTSYLVIDENYVLVKNENFEVYSLAIHRREPQEGETESRVPAIGNPLSPVWLYSGVHKVYESADASTVIYKKVSESLQEAIRGHFRSRSVVPEADTIPDWPLEFGSDSNLEPDAEQDGDAEPASAPESESESD